MAGNYAEQIALYERALADDRYASIARLRAVGPFGAPKICNLFETTYFVGLRNAGMAEE